MNKIAITQRPPVLLDRSGARAVVADSIGKAATAGASLIVLPETFVSGQPRPIRNMCVDCSIGSTLPMASC